MQPNDMYTGWDDTSDMPDEDVGSESTSDIGQVQHLDFNSMGEIGDGHFLADIVRVMPGRSDPLQ